MSQEQLFQKANKLLEKKQYKKAIKILKQLDEENYSEATLLLGVLYFFGDGVEKNIDKVSKYLNKAFDLGNYKALFWFGFLAHNYLLLKEYVILEHNSKDFMELICGFLFNLQDLTKLSLQKINDLYELLKILFEFVNIEKLKNNLLIYYKNEELSKLFIFFEIIEEKDLIFAIQTL